MKSLRRSSDMRVARGRLASAAQPPHATAPALLTPPVAQPFRSFSFLDIPDAVRVDLRCLPVCRPLPSPAGRYEEKPSNVFV